MIRSKTSGGVATTIRVDAIKYAAVLLLSLFDFYKWGIRVFDIVAYCLIAIALLIASKRSRVSASWLVILFFATIYFIIGSTANSKYSSALALFINCSLFFLLSSSMFQPERRHIEFTMAFHLLFFMLQLMYFYVFGEILNYHAFTDLDPRLESSIFRPAGLFYEPAIFCLTMFVLLTILNPTERKFNVVEYLAILAMLLSVSLLGFLFVAMSVARMIRYKKWGILIVTIPVVFALRHLPIDEFVVFIGNRTSDLSSDASAGDRYGRLFNVFSESEFPYYFFGRGFGADFEQFGSSGISAALAMIGIVGLVSFGAWLLFKSRDRFTVVFVLVAILISAPIFSYGIFPFWLANVVDHRRKRP